jgi:hypothetical protein
VQDTKLGILAFKKWWEFEEKHASGSDPDYESLTFQAFNLTPLPPVLRQDEALDAS